MTVPVMLVITVVIVALAFDFTNGFHDAANAIATVVATKALSLRQALIMATLLNILGAFFSTAVTRTIESGILKDVGDPVNAQLLVLSALIGAILWNLTTWYYAMPSSSSHAIIGGLVGAGIAYGHRQDIIMTNIIDKVIIPMVVSPVCGLIAAGLLMLVIARVFRRIPHGGRPTTLKRLQILSGAFMAFSHGSNDAQKTMGVIMLALVGAGLLSNQAETPWWVILLCGTAMGLGTLAGGRRIIETVGNKITRLDYESGVAANLGSAVTIMACAQFGLPVSTTHVVVGGITGAGLAQSGKANPGVWRNMCIAWLCTLPGSAGFALAAYLILTEIQ